MESPVLNGATRSVWHTQVPGISTSALDSDQTADVCIVGGGIAGLTTAYFLALEGRSVVVLEANELGSGQSGRTTAHFVSALDDRYFHLETLHGFEGMRTAAESHAAAIERVESVILRERINCEWQRLPGFLFLSPEHDRKYLEKELDAAQRAGLTDLRILTRVPNLAFDTGPCILFPRQGQLHIMKYLAGLARAIERLGGKIFTQTSADVIETSPEIRVVTNRDYVVKADSLVVATNTPINDLAVIHTKQAPYRTYVVAAVIARGSMDPMLLWETGDPYHYIRTTPLSDANELLIVGGEDHKAGQNSHPEKAFAALEDWTRKRFPFVTNFTHRWSGQVLEPIDDLGFLGRNPLDKNTYVITGDSGNGMTHSTIGAWIVDDLIQGRSNAWAKLYSPSRVTLKSTPEFLKENSNVLYQYKDFLLPAEQDLIHDIPVGEGAVIRHGLHLIAAYRESAHRVHTCSAVCPHMGCVVKWNPVEKSWDCPCHGSRFDKTGKCLNGPAIADLEEINPDSRPEAPA